jgi:hypothetical protein
VRGKRIVTITFCAGLAATGCASTLMNQPVERAAKGWRLVLEQVKDGPNSYARGDNVHFVPPDGARFLWFTIRLRNTESAARTFNYDRCDLDSGSDAILPALIDKNAFINIMADKEEELAPGEELSRRIAFAYPDDKLPSRLACGELVVELPFAQAR